MPMLAGTYGAGLYGRGPYGMAAVVAPSGNLAQPVAEYAIRVRNASRQIVGEISQYQSAGFTLRYNNVSAWMVELDANDPLASALAADGAGIQIVRVLRDPTTGQRLSGGVILSGPRWGRVRQMAGRTLMASGYDDLIWLQGRLAYPYTGPTAYSGFITPLSGLLRYYRLSETSGTVATDSKSAQNGTYTGGFTLSQPTLVDSVNTAAAFDGSTGYVSLPTTSLPTGNNPWYMGVWFNAAAFPTGANTAVLMGYGNWGTNLAAPHIALNSSGQLYAGTYNGDTTPGTNTAVALGTTHLAVATWDGTTLTCYLDGVSVATATPGALNVTLTAATLAANPPHSAGFFNGVLDEAIIGSGTLSADTIANLYARGVSRFQAVAYDTRTGPAETVIRGYVNANAISAANNPQGHSRVVAGLTLEPDLGRGATVTGNGRFDQLIVPDGTGLLQQLAQSGGLGFRVVQQGTSLVFQVYGPTDRTASVIFSEALGNLADYSYQEDGPDFSQGGNSIVVGGGGVGTLRLFQTRDDGTSIGRWGLFENFQDARDTPDLATLQQRGDATLAQSAVSTQFACTLAPQRAIVYGQDVNVGDTVTVVIDGVSFANILREVQITLDANGAETVTPAVASPNADTIRQLFGGFVQQRQLTNLRSTADKLARSQ